jgi:hypothetical protein
VFPGGPLRNPVGGEEAIFPHEGKHPLLGHPNALLEAQAGPYLAVALA